MAVTKFKQIGAGRKGGAKDASDRSYVVAFLVIVNDRRDGPLTISQHPDCPLRFQPYTGFENNDDPLAVCVDTQVDQDGDDWQKWRVTCTFSTKSQNPNQQEDPEEEPPIFWIENERVEESYTKEYDGTDIKNSAGQLIAGLTRKRTRETYVWEKNYVTLNRGVWKDHQDSMNSDEFDELGQYEGLLNIIVPKPTYRNGQAFYRVQFRVEVNPDKWTVEPADRGTMVKNSNGKLEAPKDEMGQPIDGEVPLKSDGSQQRDATAAIRYLSPKKPYKPRAFAAILPLYG